MSSIPARGAQVLVPVKKYLEYQHQPATAITGFVNFLGINRDNLQNDALSEAHKLQLLLDVISAAVKDDCFLDVIEKAHAPCFPAKILTFSVADSHKQGIRSTHLGKHNPSWF
jgi:hypothetical protein